MPSDEPGENATTRSPLAWLERHPGKAAWLTVALTFVLMVVAFRDCGSGQKAGVFVSVTPTSGVLAVGQSPVPTVAPSTPTIVPIPALDVQRLGVGSRDLPVKLVLEVTNLSPDPVVLWGVMHDTDTHQNRLYKAGRVDVDGDGNRGQISFAGWYPGACYVARLLMARTENGLDDLVSWFQEESGTTRSYTEVIATGDIAAIYADDSPVCISPMTPSP